MLKHAKIQNLKDYFVNLEDRQNKGVYFYRINGYSKEIGEFIKKYYEVARHTGVVIEGKIANPNENNLAYYNEIMGEKFQMSVEFISINLKKWLPRMNDFQRRNVAISIFDNLNIMKNSGKTEAMLRNAYIKFMCWLYYKFERIVNQLGNNNLPKILYEGEISTYELMFMSILSNSGCDIILLQYTGDQSYRKLDPNSVFSDNLLMDGMQPFPQNYCIKSIKDEIQHDLNIERLYGTKSIISNCTNAWIKGNGFADIRENVKFRGDDNHFFYNCFFRINGVEDRMTYTNDLYRLQQEIKNSKRKLVIVNGEIPIPTPEEIAKIKRSNYMNLEQMIMGLSHNIKYTFNIELQRIIQKTFVDVILAESNRDRNNLRKLTNKAIYLLCWLERYSLKLFSNWKTPDVSCFFYMGGCKSDTEALFLSFLGRLPVDVLILCPNQNIKCCLKDDLLYEINYSNSLSIVKYPEEHSQVKIGTAAYHAERDLDTLLYQDTGMYRSHQHGKANIICLQTMYEEISILWNQELKYRPNFSTTDGVVNMPVIFAKVSGIKDGLVSSYWNSVRELITEDTVVIKNLPYISSTAENPMKMFATEFFKNGKLQKNKIMNHPQYPYRILRRDMQDFLLEKLQSMIEQKLIKGIGENGTEYTVVAQVLNLPKDIIRLIQKFDFTKKNPKIIYINTGEKMISLEDSILVMFLHLIGFDIVFFVPTGYQSIEKYFSKNMTEEHQIGEYKYDLQIPNLSMLSQNNTRSKWRDKFFKRGN